MVDICTIGVAEEEAEILGMASCDDVDALARKGEVYAAIIRRPRAEGGAPCPNVVAYLWECCRAAWEASLAQERGRVSAEAVVSEECGNGAPRADDLAAMPAARRALADMGILDRA